jgi:hypothetical protein
MSYYNGYSGLLRRVAPRIPVETLCSELVQEREQFGLIVDLSEEGLRLQSPLGGLRSGRVLQLEFELPEADEIIWAKGEVCFDQLWRVREAPAGAMRTSGVRLIAAARKHLQLLRDWTETMRRRIVASEQPWAGRFWIG